MSWVHYHPIHLLNRIEQDINRAQWLAKKSANDVQDVLMSAELKARCGSDGPATAPEWVPAVDVREEEKHYVIEMDVPGMRTEAIAINTEERVLSISGERTRDEKASGHKRGERRFGKFLRQFSLPENAATQKISAKLADGILTVVIPKQERAQPKRIVIEH